MQRVLLLVGSLGPLGHLPASGTVTVAVFAWPMAWLVSNAGILQLLALLVLTTGLAVWIHQVGDRILGEKDSRKLVWDEIVGFQFALIALPWTWQVVLIAFVLERAIDIAKVPPASWIERRWPGGWGVVGDDVVAGLYTCGLMHLLLYAAGPMLGA